MKKTRGVFTIALALCLTLAFGGQAFAQSVVVGGGSGSITVTNTTVGESYTIYKLFDANVSADGQNIAYTSTKSDLTAGGVDGGQWFSVSPGGQVAGTSLVSEAALKTEDFKKWAVAFGTKVGQTTQAAETQLTFSELPYGYYYVESSLGATISVTSTKPHASVVDKNQGAVWEGKVVIDDQNGKHRANVAAFDEDITFDIGVSATNFNGANKVYRYLITDVLPAGMTYKGNLSVKVGDTTVNPIAQQATTGYTVKYYSDAEMTAEVGSLAEARAFKVYIPWTTDGAVTGNHLYAATASLHVGYTAFLDSTKAAQVNYNEPNVNTASFDYYVAGEDYFDQDPDHNIPTSITNTYISELNVSKFFYNNQVKTPLSGAEFTLKRAGGFAVSFTQEVTYEPSDTGTFWKLKNDTYTAVDPASLGVDDTQYASTSQKYVEKLTRIILRDPASAGNIKAFVDANGNVIFSGLIEGDYTLEETVVPAGFNKAENISFTVKFTEDINPLTQEPTGTGTWSEATSSAPGAVGDSLVVYNADTKRFEASVENRSGIMLPMTGGVGIALLLLAGIALSVMGGMSYACTRRCAR